MPNFLGNIPPYFVIAFTALGSLTLFLYLYLQEKYKTLISLIVVFFALVFLIYFLQTHKGAEFQVKSAIEKYVSIAERFFERLEGELIPPSTTHNTHIK